MATKKNETIKPENNALEPVETDGLEGITPENTVSESTEIENAKETTATTQDTSDDMDLNELLESMNGVSDEESLAVPEDAETFPTELFEDLETDTDTPTDIPGKPKRTSRKGKAQTAEASDNVKSEEMHADNVNMPSDVPTAPEETFSANTTEDSTMKEMSPSPDTSIPSAQALAKKKASTKPVLTIVNRVEVETDASKEDAIWHEIHNAYRTRKIITGQLGGIEQLDNGKTIVIVDYKGSRIIIPLKEMMINLGRMPFGQEYVEFMQRQNKILGNMLGAEIDFVVRGIDSKTHSVVASRREAMLKKRQTFYMDTDSDGMYRIFEGRVVQARVIAVAEKVIRVEVFGVECSIMARDLSWDWIGDAHERFSVGDLVLVRILSVRRDDLENISIKADIKSVSQNTSHDNLKKCRIQSKYAGKVTDVYKGVVYIRLSNGVNAVAHSCFDHRTPGKKDDVSFAVTKLDEERGVAVGIITRIIRQNL